MPATYRKLLEEVGELGEAIMLQHPDRIQEEAGDVAILLAHIVRGGCPDRPSLSQAMAVALDKIERRAHAKKRAAQAAGGDDDN